MGFSFPRNQPLDKIQEQELESNMDSSQGKFGSIPNRKKSSVSNIV